ncbi:putative leukotriene A-4 hydrolase (LTA-4 hydrolase) (Leukotriene A(4) hydrolase) [Borealophlyctis nickersoniae]|nr:putative leukotriene A-4 hydrolase (LTA-4 hydrolase) (Leukotriene A(4) hydrolase) [Borealophlyctis nickersoniae]
MSSTAAATRPLPPLCPNDPNSYANTDKVKVTHLHLALAADFDRRILHGHVDVTAKIVKGAPDELVLDASYLNVKRIVELKDDGSEGRELQHQFADRDEKLGSPLTIALAPGQNASGDSLKIRIHYETMDKCTAIQWLEPRLVIGFLFTHPEHVPMAGSGFQPDSWEEAPAIHARSLVPCQDTPSVKITYSSEISAPSNLRALMSALRKGEEEVEDRKVFKFEQPIAMPSYLIALAIGNIDGRQVGQRSTVWSEPEVVDAAAWEFSETETFIATGEKLLTPYVWGIYDLLLLPSSFPYGGMENPCLTFVTPTLLAGDRSLVDVVAHEIAHSWMGNLVTTQNWEHFWLNEGFTVFIERKIEGRLHGQPVLEFDAIIGMKALKESVEHFKDIGRPEFSVLVPSLKNEDPDDAFSSVPYEKGFNLLFYLEKLVGGASVFEPYLAAHVEKFSHTSITTTDFKSFLYEYFRTHHPDKVPALDSVDWEAWFKKPGMPIVDNKFDTTLANACEELANKWDSSRDVQNPTFPKSDFERFTTKQKMMFLEKLLQKKPLPHHTLKSIDAAYDLTPVKNAEIRFRWQWLCLMADYEDIFGEVVAFITSVGRMKFVRPLYRQLSKCKNGAQLARKTFLEHRSFYHPICATMVAKDLGIKS